MAPLAVFAPPTFRFHLETVFLTASCCLILRPGGTLPQSGHLKQRGELRAEPGLGVNDPGVPGPQWVLPEPKS